MLDPCLARCACLAVSLGRWTLAVARAGEVVPAETGCAGGCRYDLKWDG
jgi:hypothetical protein